MPCEDKKAALLSGAIRAVAHNGLENTTTRSIGAEAGIDDAYIYRFFKDKEELLCQAFLTESKKLDELVLQSMDMVRSTPTPPTFQESCRFVLGCAWKYLTGHPEISLFMIRYYHSAGFDTYAAPEFRTYLSRIIERSAGTYPLADNASVVYYHLMESLLGFAGKVAAGGIPNTDATAGAVFQQLYGIMKTALDTETGADAASQ